MHMAHMLAEKAGKADGAEGYGGRQVQSEIPTGAARTQNSFK